ncbi:GNAT family N-acetyltransferase [Tengunoibacter tsumagoiensis]|uniref:GNAT family acetyltransferase n=1 Tax=Tengunoibacter tsumagoiensis TaxID=2014871 RepID=A0A402A997_9CHLR|nr:GNAT family N-acetyltransferase [Tengunoibacter tsumagoiensis]GCE15720.1 GNAT family acetyltransferase [Tengunoibacter tsumagoiensis]
MGSMIVEDTSLSSMAQALDANKIAFGTLLGGLSGAQVYQEPGLVWFETGVPNNLFNGVLQTSLPTDTAPEAIKRVLEHFQVRQLPFHWHIGPASQTAELRALLAAQGIEHDEDEPGMGLDLSLLNEDLPLADNVTIRPVTNHDLLNSWIKVWGCGAPDEILQHWFTIYSRLPFGPEQDLRLFIGYVDEEPVGVVALYLAAGVAAIEWVVTLHQFRRQGIGAFMTMLAAKEARNAGYRIAVLTASPFGINIYRRMGFQECCLVNTYEWSPQDA